MFDRSSAIKFLKTDIQIRKVNIWSKYYREHHWTGYNFKIHKFVLHADKGYKKGKKKNSQCLEDAQEGYTSKNTVSKNTV